jgi:UDP-N-acetylglucosamine--N-acetylmuramyl-(pentapeptide) pyrophosphoryl-undecaprenol N-acetylglucosamine transferase
LKKVLITLGATGGHIFPAISLLEAIEELDKGFDVRFVNSLNNKITIPNLRNDNTIYKINSVGFIGKSLSYKIKSLYSLLVSIIQSMKIIVNFAPDIIIGTGGFVSLPVALSGLILKKRIYIVEGNSVPGLSNKIIALFCKKIFINFEESKKHFGEKKCVKSGFPIRKLRINNEVDKDIDILILGGSQGSKVLNNKITDSMYSLIEKIKKSQGRIYKFKVVHQCGSGNKVVIEKFYLDIKKEFPFFEFQVYEFINNIEVYYQRSKILISRAGASTISESLHFNLPSIYVPIKNSSGDHQFLNAEEVSSNELGLMSVEKELSDVFLNKIHNLLYNQTIRDTILKAMRKNAEVRNSDSAENIIEGILEDVR